MKKLLLTITCLVAFHLFESNAQVLRAFAPRYYNASARGSIVYVSNGIVSTNGIGAGVPGTAEIPAALCYHPKMLSRLREYRVHPIVP